MAAGKTDRVRQLVINRCVETGVSYAKLSDLVGKNQTYIQQWAKDGSPRNLSDDNLKIIAAALGLDVADLQYRDDEYRLPSKRVGRTSARARATVGFPTDRRASARTYRRFIEQDELLPVYRIIVTAGNHDAVYSITDKPVSQIAMPQPLMGVPGAYAFMASHDLTPVSMIHSDDTVLVNSVLQPRKDDVCVLRRPAKDSTEIVICHVCEATRDKLTIISMHGTLPDAPRKLKPQTIKRADWPDVGVVVGLYLRR